MDWPTENKAAQLHDPEAVQKAAHAEEQLTHHNNKCKQHRTQPDPEDPRGRRKKNEKMCRETENGKCNTKCVSDSFRFGSPGSGYILGLRVNIRRQQAPLKENN